MHVLNRRRASAVWFKFRIVVINEHKKVQSNWILGITKSFDLTYYTHARVYGYTNFLYSKARTDTDKTTLIVEKYVFRETDTKIYIPEMSHPDLYRLKAKEPMASRLSIEWIFKKYLLFREWSL